VLGEAMTEFDGRLLRKLRLNKGWSIREFARQSKVSDSEIGLLERGIKKNPTPKTTDKLYKALGYQENKPTFKHPGSVVEEIDSMVKSQIAVFAEVSAGDAEMEPIDYVAVSRLKPVSESIRAYRVKGLCLEPEIKDGDTLIVDTSLAPQSGNLVVVIIEGSPSVKRYRSYPDGKKWLENNDGRYTPESVHLHGVVTDVNHRLV